MGADFFTYKYSISRGGNQDVGAVAKMWLEDTEHDLKYFPKFAYKINDLIMHVYRKKALKENLNYFYFYKNLLKTKRVAEKAKKPLLLTEYGYLDDPNVLNTLYDYLLIKDLCGHVWYNWTNFDPNLDGTIEKSALFDRFKAICIQIEKIKQLEYRNRLSS